MRFVVAPDATPLDPQVVVGLKPNIVTQEELNEFEANNIAAAIRWIPTSRILKRGYPTVTALLRLHKAMFDRTWKWAGKYRSIDTTIGIERYRVPMELKSLCDDTHFWIADDVYGWDERAARFHHRLVQIHPFNNGNGRHSRLATDILLRQNGRREFTWGSHSIIPEGPTRRAYIDALQAADEGEIAPLLAFART